MNNYFELRKEYFEELATQTELEAFNNGVENQLDGFFENINNDGRYIIKRPTARFIGHVEKQN